MKEHYFMVDGEVQSDMHIYRFLAAQMIEFMQAYLPRIRAIISLVYRYVVTPEDLQIIEAALVGCVRIRIDRLALAVLDGGNISEVALMSQIPTVADLDIEAVGDVDDVLSLSQYTTVMLHEYPSSGPHFVGRSFRVEVGGRSVLGYTDYKHVGPYPDLIIPGEFVAGEHKAPGGTWIPYYHIDEPNGKSSIPHYRLSHIDGRFALHGEYHMLPSFMRTLASFLAHPTYPAYKAAIMPATVLQCLPNGAGYVRLIERILNGVLPKGVTTMRSAVEYTWQHNYGPFNYKASHATTIAIARMSYDIRQLYGSLFTDE